MQKRLTFFGGGYNVSEKNKVPRPLKTRKRKSLFIAPHNPLTIGIIYV